MDGGSIVGAVTLSGPIPAMPPRQIGNKDPQVCGTGVRQSESLIVNSSGGVKNAVVIVEGVTSGKAISDAATPPLDQKGCEYTPHVNVVLKNTEIAMRNSDPVLHTIQFFEGDQSLFNIAQPIQGQVTKYKIESAGVINVECAVHGWMRGNVVVVDNPYYATTDENGKFSITDVPPGRYRVRIWHEFLGEQIQEVTLTPRAETALNVDLRNLLASVKTAVAQPGPETDLGNAPRANEVVVSMLVEDGGTTFRFEPKDITIKVGTTVRWVNESEPRHTSTNDPEWETPQSPAILPPGAPRWRTRFLQMGQSGTHTFTVPGKYQYFCETHGPYGMTASITVTP
jgi:plastocyanin